MPLALEGIAYFGRGGDSSSFTFLQELRLCYFWKQPAFLSTHSLGKGGGGQGELDQKPS